MIRSITPLAASLILSLAAVASAADFQVKTVLPALPGLSVSALPGAGAGAAPSAGLSAAVPLAPAPSAAPASAQVRGYAERRQDLALVAEKTGIVASLPVVSEVLKAWLIGQAADKKVVFSDYDDTLGAFSSIASPQTAAALAAVQASGKQMVVVSDRPDTKKEGSKAVTILESLSSIPASQRAGIIVAANKGGRILSYDAAGEAKLVYEEPPMTHEVVAKIKDAVESVKAKLAGLGTAVHDGSKNIPAETYGPYHYGLMLKIGTLEDAVRATAQALEAELAARGLGYEVEPRFAKDPANPPYVTFSKLDKTLAVGHIARMLKTRVEDALILGDSMFKPKWAKPAEVSPEVAQAAARAGVDLENPPAGLTGNAVDRSMEKALPGALTLSVGGTADPGMSNGYVMPGKGPEVTREILEAVAFGPKGGAPARASVLARFVRRAAAVGGMIAASPLVLAAQDAGGDLSDADAQLFVGLMFGGLALTGIFWLGRWVIKSLPALSEWNLRRKLFAYHRRRYAGLPGFTGMEFYRYETHYEPGWGMLETGGDVTTAYRDPRVFFDSAESLAAAEKIRPQGEYLDGLGFGPVRYIVDADAVAERKRREMMDYMKKTLKGK